MMFPRYRALAAPVWVALELLKNVTRQKCGVKHKQLSAASDESYLEQLRARN